MSNAPLNLQSLPSQGIHGECEVPGDKSISHRALIFASIAEGQSTLHGFLESADCIATRSALRHLGVNIETKDKVVKVHGVGLHGLKQAPKLTMYSFVGEPYQGREGVYCGNSGTAMRLLAGLLCGQKFDSLLAGDISLSTRPMQRIAEPLRKMAGTIELGHGGVPPILIKKAQAQLQGIEYALPVASAQVKSALLLAGLYANSKTTLTGKIQTRNHSELMLQTLGYPLQTDSNSIVLEPGHTLKGREINIPGDISSAAFLMAAACITAQSHLRLKGVGVNPTRDGVIHLLKKMGANIHLHHERALHEQGLYGLEPVADIEIRPAQEPLKGIKIPKELIANVIDELPVLLMVAACAQGKTILSGAEELRYKESDRIDAMAQGLSACGVEVETKADGMIVHGKDLMGENIDKGLRGANIDSVGDHRIAMAFLVGGLVSNSPMQVKNCNNIETSFPGFVELANRVGLNVSPIDLNVK